MSVETTVQANSQYLMPGAIVIAGFVVAGALFATQGGSVEQQVVPTGKVLEATILPVTERDHVYGPRDADVFLIEYSDYRCGYCGMFHDRVKEVLALYEGKIAWVYRHLPFQPGGREAAVASECVAELAGKDAFWQYTEKALKNQRDLSPEWHAATAVELGADKAAFEECVASGRYDELISEHSTNAQELGGNGTPFNVLLTKKGDIVKFSGAQPVENMKVFIDRALRSLE